MAGDTATGTVQTINNQIYNNLFITSATGDVGIRGITNESSTSYLDNIWNNITIAGGRTIQAYQNRESVLTADGSTANLAYMDYNVYDGAPVYNFGGDAPVPKTTYSLTSFQAQGFEQHAIVAAASSIFVDQVSYVLQPAFQTAGRYGDAVGPRCGVALILNASRYGPGALSTGSSPEHHPTAPESDGSGGRDSHLQRAGEWFGTLLPVAEQRQRRDYMGNHCGRDRDDLYHSPGLNVGQRRDLPVSCIERRGKRLEQSSDADGNAAAAAMPGPLSQAAAQPGATFSAVASGTPTVSGSFQAVSADLVGMTKAVTGASRKPTASSAASTPPVVQYGSARAVPSVTPAKRWARSLMAGSASGLSPLPDQP